MKNVLSFIALMSLSLVSVAADQKNPGVVAGEGSGSEISFPAKPKEIAQGTGKQWILERENGSVALMLQFNPFPNAVDTTNATAVDAIMDSGRSALIKALKNSELASEKKFKYDNKYPARDIDVNHPVFGIYRVRFIVTPTKFYQVTILGPKDYQNKDEAKSFMNSFKLK